MNRLAFHVPMAFPDVPRNAQPHHVPRSQPPKGERVVGTSVEQDGGKVLGTPFRPWCHSNVPTRNKDHHDVLVDCSWHLLRQSTFWLLVRHAAHLLISRTVDAAGSAPR